MRLDDEFNTVVWHDGLTLDGLCGIVEDLFARGFGEVRVSYEALEDSDSSIEPFVDIRVRAVVVRLGLDYVTDDVTRQVIIFKPAQKN